MKRKRKPITPREMEAAYRLCLERERIRERDWRKTRQGAFESNTLYLDMEKEEAIEREKSTSWLSDRGRGARQIPRGLLNSPEEFAGRIREAKEKGLPPPKPKPTREQLIDCAKHLVARKAKDCLKVFWLILKNGSNRKESIWQLEKLTHAKKAKSSSLKKAPKRPSTGTN